MSIKDGHCAPRHKLEVNFRKALLWPNLNEKEKTCDKTDFPTPTSESSEMWQEEKRQQSYSPDQGLSPSFSFIPFIYIFCHHFFFSFLLCFALFICVSYSSSLLSLLSFCLFFHTFLQFLSFWLPFLPLCIFFLSFFHSASFLSTSFSVCSFFQPFALPTSCPSFLPLSTAFSLSDTQACSSNLDAYSA